MRRSDDYLQKLKGRSLRLALERPENWEMLLFAQVVEDAVHDASHLRREHQDGLAIVLGEDVTRPQSWVSYRFQDRIRLVHAMDTLINGSLSRVVQPKGADAAEIVYVGEALGRVYEQALLWGRRGRSANIVDEQLHPLRDELVRFADDVIHKLEGFGATVQRTIADALAIPAEHRRTTDITLEIQLSNEEGFSRELERLRAMIERGETVPGPMWYGSGDDQKA